MSVFLILGICHVGLSIACVFVDVSNFFSSSTFYRAGFENRHCLNLVLSWNILFSLSMVIESFAGYVSVGWHLWSLSVCITSYLDLLLIVSVEKSG